MDELKRFSAVALLLFGALAVGFAASGFSAGGFSGSGNEGPTGPVQNYTVTGLLEERPLKTRVEVEANVSAVLDDYVSDAGNTFQQFYVSDGRSEVKVFCSTSGGRAELGQGDRVRVSGEFQEFYGEYEIYTRCGSVRES